MSLGENVRRFREERGWDQHQLAEAVRKAGGQVAQTTISDIENNISKRPRCLHELAEVFGVSIKELRDGPGPAGVRPRANVRTRTQPVEDRSTRHDDADRDQVVTFWGRLVEEGRAGGWMVYPERGAGSVELGPAPAQAPRLFRLEVLDSDNVPAFEPRDTIWCNPDRHPFPGNNCVFAGAKGPDDGEIPAVLGRLIRVDSQEWVVKQYRAGNEMKLPKATWLYAWVVVRRDPAV